MNSPRSSFYRGPVGSAAQRAGWNRHPCFADRLRARASDHEPVAMAGLGGSPRDPPRAREVFSLRPNPRIGGERSPHRVVSNARSSYCGNRRKTRRPRTRMGLTRPTSRFGRRTRSVRMQNCRVFLTPSPAVSPAAPRPTAPARSPVPACDARAGCGACRRGRRAGPRPPSRARRRATRRLRRRGSRRARARATRR